MSTTSLSVVSWDSGSIKPGSGYAVCEEAYVLVCTSERSLPKCSSKQLWSCSSRHSGVQTLEPSFLLLPLSASCWGDRRGGSCPWRGAPTKQLSIQRQSPSELMKLNFQSPSLAWISCRGLYLFYSQKFAPKLYVVHAPWDLDPLLSVWVNGRRKMHRIHGLITVLMFSITIRHMVVNNLNPSTHIATFSASTY